jgi:hypothetical protein
MVYDVARRKAFRPDGHQHAMRQEKKGSNPLHKVPHGCWAAVKGLVRTGFNAVWQGPPHTQPMAVTAVHPSLAEPMRVVVGAGGGD